MSSRDSRVGAPDPELSTTLRTILDDLLSCARALHETLIAEREALTGHNLSTLNVHTDAKKDYLVRLEALEVQRRQILNSMNLDPGQELFVPELNGIWQAVLEQLKDCQEANEVNGAIVRTHQTQTQRALDLLAGRDGRQTVYEADGLPARRPGSSEIAKA